MSKPTTPVHKNPLVQIVSPEDMQKVSAAYAAAQKCQADVQAARDVLAKANEGMIGANAVLVHVSKEMGEKYSIGPNDTVDADGVITRGTGA